MGNTFVDTTMSAVDYFNGDRQAAEGWARKYCLRDTKSNGNGKIESLFVESTPDDMHRRIAREMARIDKKLSPNSYIEEGVFYDALRKFDRIIMQGSPSAAIGNPYQYMSASNCFVIDSPDDSIGDIFTAGRQMAELMKRRGGVGIDLSKLRPAGTRVNNAALSSNGAWSFADFYSYITRMIGQKGREGALMVTMHIRHPDSPLFAVAKADLSKITGANISLRIDDEFMEAVINDEEYELRWPVEGTPKITEKVRAVELWNTITEQAHKTGEPGLLMWDNITKNLPAHCYERFKTLSTNPCLAGDTLFITNDVQCPLPILIGTTIDCLSFCSRKFLISSDNDIPFVP